MATKQQRSKPEVAKVLRTVLQADWPDELEVKQIQIRVLGTGEVAWKMLPADGGDYVGGVATVQA
jgi:hypothetical protein